MRVLVCMCEYFYAYHSLWVAFISTAQKRFSHSKAVRYKNSDQSLKR